MKKTLTLLSLTIMIIGQSLTNVGFAANGDQEVIVVCDACTTGSPSIKSYIQLMNDILKILEATPSQNPGAIPGQGNNIETKKSQSNIWAQRSNDASISITDQSNGVKSDMIALNRINDRIILAGVGLINTKFVWSKLVPNTTITSLEKAFATQVGNDKLFINAGSLGSSTTYAQLLELLISFHSEISKLPSKNPPTGFARQGYRSNPLMINKIIIYYECAHQVPTCRSQTITINETASSVKRYWAQIVRAGQQIQDALSKEYRDTSQYNNNANVFTKEGRKKLMSKIQVNVNGRSVSDLYSQITKSSKNKQSQQSAEKSKQMQQAQIDEIDQLIRTQIAIKNGVQITIPSSSTRIKTIDQPTYNLRAMETLIAGLNAQSDRIITKMLNDQKAAILADSREFTYQIPDMAQQIYKAGLAVNDAANMAKNKCLEHCSNINNGDCGVSVAS